MLPSPMQRRHATPSAAIPTPAVRSSSFRVFRRPFASPPFHSLRLCCLPPPPFCPFFSPLLSIALFFFPSSPDLCFRRCLPRTSEQESFGEDLDRAGNVLVRAQHRDLSRQRPTNHAAKGLRVHHPDRRGGKLDAGVQIDCKREKERRGRSAEVRATERRGGRRGGGKRRQRPTETAKERKGKHR